MVYVLNDLKKKVSHNRALYPTVRLNMKETKTVFDAAVSITEVSEGAAVFLCTLMIPRNLSRSRWLHANRKMLDILRYKIL